MRSVLLAAVLALGFGLATTGAQAATVNGNVATLKTAAATTNSGVVEKADYRRGRYYHRHWRRGWHRPYYRHYRPYRYWGPRYHHRGYYWRHHHRHWR